uniref:LITAF domain-containing protein n=1 Tax=Panagrolaimus sp. PS1159 TaxID=55785 RepID=A0AC35FA12_9BILA
MGYESDLPIYAPRPGYNPNVTATAPNEPPPKYESTPTSITTNTIKTVYIPVAQPELAPTSITTNTIKTVYIPIAQPELGRKSQRMICPNCHKNIKTKVTYKSSGSAWASCCLLACLGCCLCCLLPFCLDSFQDIEHRCPKCKAYIGKYRK